MNCLEAVSRSRQPLKLHLTFNIPKTVREVWFQRIGLSSVLRPRQHTIGYMGDGFYRSKDPPTVSKYWRDIQYTDNRKTIIAHITKNTANPLVYTNIGFQRTTNRKWHMGYRMVTWPMTSRDRSLKGRAFYTAVRWSGWAEYLVNTIHH